MLYFLLVNYQSYSWIAQLINSQLNWHQLQLVIVNNFPPEKQALQQLKTDTIHIIELGENLGFGRGCNVGLAWIYHQDPQALVWLVNPDIWLDPKMVNKALWFTTNYPEISILGTVIYSKDHQVWFGGGTFDSIQGKIASKNLFQCHPKTAYVVCDWVSGCSMIINLNHFPDCPQFDPHYFLYYEDFDLCQRYQHQGHLIAVTNEISLIHQVSAITNCNLKQKFYHSSYSYLLTLEKYTHSTVFYGRLTRLLIHALILLPIKPAIALGKITGTWHYFQQRVSGVISATN